ncbi:efflux RND transporter periplasmic adaptor subunit [Myxococcota bacterium]|nr:efflux RND transporter periplasmic adaptor subunit [Myxococcota bacterium]MBU1534216.1 efflux RND transporter periplasmic adaptor subunit [Myxococcota bacterium]
MNCQYLSKAFAALFIFFVFGCSGQSHGHDHGGDEKAPSSPPGDIVLSGDQQKTLQITTEKVTRGPLKRHLTALGIFAASPQKETFVRAPYMGTLLPSPPLPPGTGITPGQVLGSIAPVADGATVESLKGSSEIDYTIWKSEQHTLKRLEEMVEKGVESRATLAKAKARESIARARLSTSWIKLRNAQNAQRGLPDARNHRLIKSSIGGIISKNNYSAGSTVQQGDLLYHILDPSTLLLRLSIQQQDLHLIKEKLSGWFRTHRQGEKHPLSSELAGHTLLPGVDPRTRTHTIIFTIKNPGGTFFAGQRVIARLTTLTSGQAVRVPLGALLQDGFFRIVFVESTPGHYQRRRVRTGMEDDTHVEVLSGLKPGETVVTSNPHELLYRNITSLMPSSAHVH